VLSNRTGGKSWQDIALLSPLSQKDSNVFNLQDSRGLFSKDKAIHLQFCLGSASITLEDKHWLGPQLGVKSWGLQIQEQKAELEGEGSFLECEEREAQDCLFLYFPQIWEGPGTVG
jgi:hypothetical protein